MIYILFIFFSGVFPSLCQSFRALWLLCTSQVQTSLKQLQRKDTLQLFVVNSFQFRFLPLQNCWRLILLSISVPLLNAGVTLSQPEEEAAFAYLQ